MESTTATTKTETRAKHKKKIHEISKRERRFTWHSHIDTVNVLRQLFSFLHSPNWISTFQNTNRMESARTQIYGATSNEFDRRRSQHIPKETHWCIQRIRQFHFIANSSSWIITIQFQSSPSSEFVPRPNTWKQINNIWNALLSFMWSVCKCMLIAITHIRNIL